MSKMMADNSQKGSAPTYIAAGRAEGSVRCCSAPGWHWHR